MKKILALVLVLFTASAADAFFLQIDGVDTDSANVNLGTTSTITIISTNSSSWLGYLIVNPGGTGLLSSASVLSAAGNLGSAKPYTEAGWGAGYELTAAMSPGGIPALASGAQFTMNYSGGVLGQTAKISLFIDPEFTIPADSITISIVPEPATVILLILGGLFIRRRL